MCAHKHTHRVRILMHGGVTTLFLEGTLTCKCARNKLPCSVTACTGRAMENMSHLTWLVPFHLAEATFYFCLYILRIWVCACRACDFQNPPPQPFPFKSGKISGWKYSLSCVTESCFEFEACRFLCVCVLVFLQHLCQWPCHDSPQ